MKNKTKNISKVALKKSTLSWRFISVLLFAIFLFVKPSNANPYSIPSSASPGAIMNHNMQFDLLQKTTPELFGPTGKNGINKVNPYDKSPVYAENGVDSISPSGDNSTFGIMKTPQGDAFVIGPQ